MDNCAKHIPDWVARFGTPLWVFNLAVVRRIADKIDQQFPNIGLELAAKSIGWPSAAKLLSSYFDGIMVCTVDELRNLLAKGMEPQCVVWYGAGRTGEEMLPVLEKNLGRIVLDSEREVENLISLKRDSQAIGTISIRVAPEGYCPSKGYERFGMPLRSAIETLRQLAGCRYSRIGLAYHADVMEMNPDNWRLPRRRLIDALATVNLPGTNIHADLGGGLPPFSLLGTEGLSLYLKGLSDCGDIHLTICLGRALVADAGWAVATVVSVKEVPNRTWVMVDAGANVLVPLPSSRFRVESFSGEPRRPCTVADAYSSFGILDSDAQLPVNLKPGDKLIIRRAGAYTWSMRSSVIAASGTALLVDDGIILEHMLDGDR